MRPDVAGTGEELDEQPAPNPPLPGRVAELMRVQVEPLCAPCVAALLGVPHLTARGALHSLAAADAFAYKQQCLRCGGGDTVVGPRAA